MASSSIEQTRKKVASIATVLFFVALLGVTAPFILTALKGLVALTAILGMLVVAYGISPWLAMKVANWRVASIKAEAAANPIETLENLRLEKEEQLKKGYEALAQLSAAVRTYKDSVDEARAKLKPNDPSILKFVENFKTIQSVEAQTKNHLLRGTEALKAFDQEIDKAKIIYKVAMAGQRATQAAKLNSPDIYEKIKGETAIESVKDSLNTVFAELETSLNQDQFKMALMGEAPPYQSIDSIPVGEKERVQ